MTRVLPQIKDAEYFPIGEAAVLLGMSRNTLRIAAENGFISCSFGMNGRRNFSGRQIKSYWKKVMGIE